MKRYEFSETDLVLNADGSVYHLHLKNQHIADIVMLVGDQDRVAQISKHFSSIEWKIKNREFVSHTGVFKGTRITALSTGIGTDNIDIVLNELFAASNINPETRQKNDQKRNLKIVRIGTSGALQPEILVGTFVASAFGLGFDGLLYYYNYPFNAQEKAFSKRFKQQTAWPKNLAKAYFSEGSKKLLTEIAFDLKQGITASGTGFYGPQGRNLTPSSIINVQQQLQDFTAENLQITNFDMETSALYGLGKIFEFECLTINAIIANRATKTYLTNHKQAVEKLIITVLNRIVQ